jgi:hypothetical protein
MVEMKKLRSTGGAEFAGAALAGAELAGCDNAGAVKEAAATILINIWNLFT